MIYYDYINVIYLFIHGHILLLIQHQVWLTKPFLDKLGINLPQVYHSPNPKPEFRPRLITISSGKYIYIYKYVYMYIYIYICRLSAVSLIIES